MTSPSLNFPQALSFLEAKGQQLYSPKFSLFSDDYEVIHTLLVYFLNDVENVKKYNISLQKGILLSGPVGCGKTSLMNLMRYFLSPDNRYIIKSCLQVTYEFDKSGYTVIQNYGKLSYKENNKPKTYCFDDLGVESPITRFGNTSNVMEEVLLSRYDQYITHKMRTHITTNLTSSELEQKYSLRVRSRLREQFNLISFNSNSRDKRC